MSWKNLETPERIKPKEAQQVEDYASRKAKPRFYADENFPAQAVAILREYGARVTTVQKVGLRRHPDENHAAYAKGGE